MFAVWHGRQPSGAPARAIFDNRPTPDSALAGSLSRMDRAGRTPLHYAAVDGSLDEVSRLLAEGSDPDAADAQGFVALHFAAQQFQPEVVERLLAAGATVDVANAFGNTPLWTAVFTSRGRGEVIALLRAAGADPSHANHAGRSPVDLARIIANWDVVQYFADLAE